MRSALVSPVPIIIVAVDDDAVAVGDLHDLEPAVAGLLERRDRRARPGRQHLRAGAGDRVQAGRLDPA